jgi:hypothetical protein
MTSSLLAVAAPADEETTSNEEGARAPLFLPAPGLYHQPTRPNIRTAS